FDDLAAGHRTHGWATRAAGWSAATLCVGTFETCRPFEQCPLSGVTRKTFAHAEFFSVCPISDIDQPDREPPRRLFFDVPRPIPVVGRLICFEAFDALVESH